MTNPPVAQPDGVVEALKLLPCPFCGRPAGIDEFVIDDDPQRWYSATCVICPVKTYDQQTPEEAARVWNIRATSADSVAEKAQRVAEKWMNTHHGSFETNAAREAALAAIITTEFQAKP